MGSGDGDFAGIVAPTGYEFVGEIGRGGMGIVFRALDLDLGREVAVKVLLPQYAPASPTARRFLDEARITGRLQHPGIPPIYRVGTFDDGRPFLAMKLIGGDTLEHLLKVRTDPDAASAAAPNHFERMAHGMFDRLAAFLESGRFLAIFEHVAQAVACAPGGGDPPRPQARQCHGRSVRRGPGHGLGHCAVGRQETGDGRRKRDRAGRDGGIPTARRLPYAALRSDAGRRDPRHPRLHAAGASHRRG